MWMLHSKHRKQPTDESAHDDQVGGVHFESDKADETDCEDEGAEPRNEGRRREDGSGGELADRDGIQQLGAGQRSVAVYEFCLQKSQQQHNRQLR